MKLTSMLNQRAMNRGLTPDVACSHQCHIVNLRNVDNCPIGAVQIDTWLLYHKNPTINFKPSSAFIKHSDVRLYCDVEGITSYLDALKFKEALKRHHVVEAIRSNVSDRIPVLIIHDGYFDEASVFQTGNYDDFLSSSNQYPMLMIRITPQRRKFRNIAIHPFQDDDTLTPAHELLQFVMDQACLEPKQPVEEIIPQFTSILNRHYQMPEKMKIHVIPCSLSLSIMENNMPLHIEYAFLILNEDNTRARLPRRTFETAFVTDITVNLVEDANSS